MEEDQDNIESVKIFCCKVPRKKEWEWVHTIVPSALSCFLHSSSLLVDMVLAWQLAWADQLLKTAVSTFTLIYIPVVFTFILKLPQLPQSYTFIDMTAWVLQLLGFMVISPILVSVSLLKRLMWNISSVRAKKPYSEILNEQETTLPKEIHSYLFLQAFLHCAPQAIFQLQLMILGVATKKSTVCLQVGSILISLVTVALCTVSFQRYEAQVAGGRLPVLLLRHPEFTDSDNSIPLVPPRFCLRGQVIGLEMDCSLGKE